MLSGALTLLSLLPFGCLRQAQTPSLSRGAHGRSLLLKMLIARSHFKTVERNPDASAFRLIRISRGALAPGFETACKIMSVRLESLTYSATRAGCPA